MGKISKLVNVPPAMLTDRLKWMKLKKSDSWCIRSSTPWKYDVSQSGWLRKRSHNVLKIKVSVITRCLTRFCISRGFVGSLSRFRWICGSIGTMDSYRVQWGHLHYPRTTHQPSHLGDFPVMGKDLNRFWELLTKTQKCSCSRVTMGRWNWRYGDFAHKI